MCVHRSLKRAGWGLRLAMPTFSILGADLLEFAGNFRFRTSLVNSRLEIPYDSPFASLRQTDLPQSNLRQKDLRQSDLLQKQSGLTLYCDSLDLVASAPVVLSCHAFRMGIHWGQ